MKKLFLCLCALFLMTALKLSGEQNTVPNGAKKYYCSSEQIEVTDSTIFVYLSDNSFEVDSLFVDQGGVYFTDDMMRCIYCRRPLNPKNTCEHSDCGSKS